MHLAEFYEMNKSALKTEYSLLKESRRDILQNCKTVLDVLQLLHQTGLHRAYSELYQLYRLFATLPITSASCERSFSKLTIVKNKLRSTMVQHRLENLMILFVVVPSHFLHVQCFRIPLHNTYGTVMCDQVT